MDSHILLPSAIDTLPSDLLVSCFLRLDSFKDLAQASAVCKKWRRGVDQSLMYREKLSFAGWRVDDTRVARLVEGANSLQELDISARRWGCHMTDVGLKRISLSLCCPNLTSISLWGVTAITDEGVIQLVSRTLSLQHLNIGGTFITDASISAIAKCCQKLEVLNLWACRHVTESGLLELCSGCPSLHSIDVWGLSVSKDCYNYLLTMNPHLQLKAGSVHRSPSRLPYWQIAH